MPSHRKHPQAHSTHQAICTLPCNLHCGAPYSFMCFTPSRITLYSRRRVPTANINTPNWIIHTLVQTTYSSQVGRLGASGSYPSITFTQCSLILSAHTTPCHYNQTRYQTKVNIKSSNTHTRAGSNDPHVTRNLFQLRLMYTLSLVVNVRIKTKETKLIPFT